MTIFLIIMIVLSFLCLLVIADSVCKISDIVAVAINKLTAYLKNKEKRETDVDESESEKLGENTDRSSEPAAQNQYIPQNILIRIKSKILTNEQVEAIHFLPWKKYKQTLDDNSKIDIHEILSELEKTHYGMSGAKQEIGRYLLSIKYGIADSSFVLLLNGEPGTGKTTLAISVAKAVGRVPFIFNLNGLYSASEILGSEFHWVGAQIGAITKAIRDTNSFNPVIIFDEIDKCSEGKTSGNIWDALMQLFDPSRKDFRDVYLDIYYDISNILFIATSNEFERIPKALLNRMRVVNVLGYTYKEKKQILENHVFPKLREKYKKVSDLVTFTSQEIEDILTDDVDDKGIRAISRSTENLFVDKLLEHEVAIKETGGVR